MTAPARQPTATDPVAFAIGFDRRDAVRLHELWGLILDSERWSEGAGPDSR